MKNPTETLLDNLSPEELSSITDRIKYLRNDILNMTQTQFALSANISQTYLSQIENGNRKINISTILRISSSLKVNLDWLIYGIGNDDNIFESDKITKDLLIQSHKQSVLTDLQNAYSLKTSELDFISWFLSLSQNQRKEYIAAIKTLSSLYNQ